MTTELLDDIHPGEILLEDFMKPLGITARQLAADMDVPPSGITRLAGFAWRLKGPFKQPTIRSFMIQERSPA